MSHREAGEIPDGSYASLATEPPDRSSLSSSSSRFLGRGRGGRFMKRRDSTGSSANNSTNTGGPALQGGRGFHGPVMGRGGRMSGRRPDRHDDSTGRLDTTPPGASAARGRGRTRPPFGSFRSTGEKPFLTGRGTDHPMGPRGGAERAFGRTGPRGRGRGRDDFYRRQERPFDHPPEKRLRQTTSFGSEGEIVDGPRSITSHREHRSPSTIHREHIRGMSSSYTSPNQPEGHGTEDDPKRNDVINDHQIVVKASASMPKEADVVASFVARDTPPSHRSDEEWVADSKQESLPDGKHQSETVVQANNQGISDSQSSTTFKQSSPSASTKASTLPIDGGKDNTGVATSKEQCRDNTAAKDAASVAHESLDIRSLRNNTTHVPPLPENFDQSEQGAIRLEEPRSQGPQQPNEENRLGTSSELYSTTTWRPLDGPSTGRKRSLSPAANPMQTSDHFDHASTAADRRQPPTRFLPPMDRSLAHHRGRGGFDGGRGFGRRGGVRGGWGDGRGPRMEHGRGLHLESMHRGGLGSGNDREGGRGNFGRQYSEPPKRLPVFAQGDHAVEKNHGDADPKLSDLTELTSNRRESASHPVLGVEQMDVTDTNTSLNPSVERESAARRSSVSTNREELTKLDVDAGVDHNPSDHHTDLSIANRDETTVSRSHIIGRPALRGGPTEHASRGEMGRGGGNFQGRADVAGGRGYPLGGRERLPGRGGVIGSRGAFGGGTRAELPGRSEYKIGRDSFRGGRGGGRGRFHIGLTEITERGSGRMESHGGRGDSVNRAEFGRGSTHDVHDDTVRHGTTTEGGVDSRLDRGGITGRGAVSGYGGRGTSRGQADVKGGRSDPRVHREILSPDDVNRDRRSFQSNVGDNIVVANVARDPNNSRTEDFGGREDFIEGRNNFRSGRDEMPLRPDFSDGHLVISKDRDNGLGRGERGGRSGLAAGRGRYGGRISIGNLGILNPERVGNVMHSPRDPVRFGMTSQASGGRMNDDASSTSRGEHGGGAEASSIGPRDETPHQKYGGHGDFGGGHGPYGRRSIQTRGPPQLISSAVGIYPHQIQRPLTPMDSRPHSVSSIVPASPNTTAPPSSPRPKFLYPSPREMAATVHNSLVQPGNGATGDRVTSINSVGDSSMPAPQLPVEAVQIQMTEKRPSPPMITPPEPIEPSGLVMEVIRLTDLEAQMEYAFCKHVQLMLKQKQLVAQIDVLQNLPIGLDALTDELAVKQSDIAEGETE